MCPIATALSGSLIAAPATFASSRGASATACNPAVSAIGDGCRATQAIIGGGGNGIGIGNDVMGNIYIGDTLNARIRKVSTNLQFAATPTTTSSTQPLDLYFIAGDTLAAATPLTYATAEWKLTPSACTTNGDMTADCPVSAVFTPAVPGARSTPLTVTSSLGNSAALAPHWHGTRRWHHTRPRIAD